MWKKLLAIVMGTVVGAALAIGAVNVWSIVHPSARPIGIADRQQLRTNLDENPKAIFMFDEATSYRFKPNYRGYRLHPSHLGDRNRVNFDHVTNSLGLLGSDEVRSDPRLPKVLLLGDSVTYGVWVDGKDTFPVRMQQLAGASCQLMTGACEGWSTKQELAFYDAYLQGIPWRAVVLVFCLNDLVDYEWKYDTAKGEPRLTEEILAAGTGGTKTSQSVSGLKLAMLRHTLEATAATAPLARQVNTALWAWDSGRWDHYLQATLTPFVERGTAPPLSIVMTPTQGQLKALAMGADAAHAMYPQLRLQRFCTAHRLTCIDLADAFVSATAEQLDRAYLDDLHFSEEGHAIVARYLWPRIKAMLDR